MKLNCSMPFHPLFLFLIGTILSVSTKNGSGGAKAFINPTKHRRYSQSKTAFGGRKSAAVTPKLSTSKRALFSTSKLYSSENDDELGSYDPNKPEPTESDMATAANDLLSNTPSTDLPDEISNSFLQYSLSIILGRALPDARDGLKPVHRRILHSMNELGLYSDSSHRKCARVVGEVLGKYHPHGDTAVYDALVRMAQDFSTGTPLIDGQGNFGSIDADPPAAMRYTECRLTEVAKDALLDDIASDTVDFIANFDGNEIEPTVLPAKIPLLLVNGCAGIAVGMATNVPPHNLCELMDACTAMIDARDEDKELSDKELVRIVPGPDFPTGASIMGQSGTKQLYATGNGGIVVRSVTHVETDVGGRSGTTAIIVTELPYQVNKSAMLEKIAALVNDKKLEGISDLRDESDRDGIRVVIELKRDAVPAVVQNNLFKMTPLQTTFSGNFLALMGSGTVPRRFTLRSALDCFLDFRIETIRRRTAFQLRKEQNRAHIVDGLLVALESIDDVIEMMRTAPDQKSARGELMDTDNKNLSLSREQADAVLKLQLGQLTKLNKDKLTDERETLEASGKELEKILSDDAPVRDIMREEFEDMKEKFGVPRRTRMEPEEGDLNELDLIRNSQSVIVVTRGGYIKRLPLETFESQGRGTRGKRSTTSNRKANEVAHCFTCNDHDTLLMVSQKGIAYGLHAYKIPTAGRAARGVPIPSVLPVNTDDVITSILPVAEFTDDEYCVLATEKGWIKKTPLAAFGHLTSRGLIIASLEDGDRLRWCEKCTDNEDILVGSRLGMATRYEAAKLRPTGRTSRGVRSMRLKEGDTVADVSILKQSGVEDEESEFVLAVTSNGYGKRIRTDEFRTTSRGGVGVIAMKFRAGRNEKDEISCLRIVKEDDEVLSTTARGVIVRQKAADIPIQGRIATGVLVQKVDADKGDRISSVSVVPKSMIDDEES